MSAPDDRRRSARVEVLGRIRGQVVSPDIELRVLEISLGGMSVETPAVFAVGDTAVFLLMLGDGSGVEVHGRVVYRRPAGGDRGDVFITGVQFVDVDDQSPGTPVGDLIKKIK